MPWTYHRDDEGAQFTVPLGDLGAMQQLLQVVNLNLRNLSCGDTFAMQLHPRNLSGRPVWSFPPLPHYVPAGHTHVLLRANLGGSQAVAVEYLSWPIQTYEGLCRWVNIYKTQLARLPSGNMFTFRVAGVFLTADGSYVHAGFHLETTEAPLPGEEDEDAFNGSDSGDEADLDDVEDEIDRPAKGRSR